MLQILLVVGASSWLIYVGLQPVDRIPVKIEAATDQPELGMPVYAQFVVTQRLTLDDPASPRALVVPMYMPVPGLLLKVRLLRYGSVVKEWNLPEDLEGGHEVVFEMENVLIDGEIEVQFDGSDISHGEKEKAPRVFVETQDFAYSDGNYRIAENEKKGDVALRLIEEIPSWQVWLTEGRDEPLAAVTRVLFTGLGLVLLWMAPRMLGRTN